jgi:hypothetical protein
MRMARPDKPARETHHAELQVRFTAPMPSVDERMAAGKKVPGPAILRILR